jgi:2-iminobutanoate/2-iminopropanoate deaminase
VSAGGAEWIFTSGQVGLVPASGELAGPGTEEETRQCLANLRAVLESAGFTFADVVKATIFLADLADFETVNAVYGEAVGPVPPARSTVQVARLPRAARVEIEMVAVRPAP